MMTAQMVEYKTKGTHVNSGIARIKGFMEKQLQNIQDVFLNSVRKDKVLVTIYLLSGVKLTGRVKSFDKYSVILETNNQDQLIFKHAISTVAAGKSYSLPAHTTAAAASNDS
jgi:host factor-I protein